MKIRLADGSGSFDLKYLFEETLPSGRTRIRFRRHGVKVTLRSPPGTDEFMQEYRQALDGITVSTPPQPHANGREPVGAGSLRWLIEGYYGWAGFKALDPRTQHVRRLILDRLCEEPASPSNPTLVGSLPFAKMEGSHVRELHDRKAEKPEAANSLLKALRQVFAWAIIAKHANRNPARDVPYRKTGSQGFHAWTVEEVRQFMVRHPIGTKAHLALGLLLFTGQRRSDVVDFGRQHIRNPEDVAPKLRKLHPGRWLRFTQRKNRRRKPINLTIPIQSDLEDIIAASPCGDLTFLVTQFGKGFTSNGFGNWFKKRCREAGLPLCSAHGLRKASATIAAENGASDRQLMAMYGWQTSKQATHYTRSANQTRLAASGMSLLAIDEVDEDED